MLKDNPIESSIEIKANLEETRLAEISSVVCKKMVNR